MDILVSLITGGATGILGTALSTGFKLFEKKQSQSHELELRKFELKQMEKEAVIAERITAMEMESATQQAEYAGLQASYKDAATRWTQGTELTPWQTWCMVFVDVVRGLMRPLITVVLVGYVGWIYRSTLSGPTLPAASTVYAPEIADPTSPVVSTVLYLATACVLWWFGSRQTDKALGK